MRAACEMSLTESVWCVAQQQWAGPTRTWSCVLCLRARLVLCQVEGDVDETLY